MSMQTGLEEQLDAHEHLLNFAMRVSTYLFVAALAVFLVWFVLLVTILFDMRENPSRFFGAMYNPGFVDYARTVVTYAPTYPTIVTILALAGVAVRLFAHSQAARLQRHEELLDALTSRSDAPEASVNGPGS